MDNQELRKRFRSFELDSEQSRTMSAVRESCLGLANIIEQRCVNSREKSLAMTKLEECSMWVNRAIALYPQEENNGD